MNHYIVEQTRTVEVFAEGAADAAKLASTAFKYGQNSDHSINITNDSVQLIHGVVGNTSSEIEETGLRVVVA